VLYSGSSQPFAVVFAEDVDALGESEEARDASDAEARQIRPRVEQETRGTMRAVVECNVVFFDVPPR
jgi:hypothetical protein